VVGIGGICAGIFDVVLGIVETSPREGVGKFCQIAAEPCQDFWLLPTHTLVAEHPDLGREAAMKFKIKTSKSCVN
jgi:hypothetical protein